jgi:hypothetical protein
MKGSKFLQTMDYDWLLRCQRDREIGVVVPLLKIPERHHQGYKQGGSQYVSAPEH